MADSGILSGIGGALGGLFGGLSSLASTQAGVSAVNDLTNVGASQVAPYNFTGANYLGQAATQLVGDGSGEIGMGRIDAPYQAPNLSHDFMGATSADPVNFQDFAKNYNASEGAKYLMETAGATQDSSASARGQLLSGANLRAQTTQQLGIANQDLIQQYQSTAAGQQQGWQQNMQSQQQGFQQQLSTEQAEQAAQQQDFQQRETSYQNIYGQEAMGLQAGIAEAGTYAQGARAVGQLYQGLSNQTATAGNNFGSALGSVFGAIGKLFGL
jgi:hypothetical protein